MVISVKFLLIVLIYLFQSYSYSIGPYNLGGWFACSAKKAMEAAGYGFNLLACLVYVKQYRLRKGSVFACHSTQLQSLSIESIDQAPTRETYYKTSFMKVLYCHLQHHNDTIIKTHAGRLLYKYVPLNLFQGFERVVWGFTVRGSGRPNRNCNILTPLLWPSALCLSCSPDAQPEVQRPTLLGDGFLYCILSASSLDPNSSGP